MARRRSGGTSRDYPRTARLNELLREVLGDALERVDDDRLGLVSISGVEVDTELTFAKVYVATADDDPTLVLAALADHRRELKRAVSTQTRLRRTPELDFRVDPSIDTGDRVEEILRGLRDTGADGDD